MEIVIQPTADAATDVAARTIAKLLKDKPDAVLGLATGNTPPPLYRKLVAMNLDWSRVTTFNLDEYIGLPADHPRSYHGFMEENLFRHVNIRRENIHIPDGGADEPPACLGRGQGRCHRRHGRGTRHLQQSRDCFANAAGGSGVSRRDPPPPAR